MRRPLPALTFLVLAGLPSWACISADPSPRVRGPVPTRVQHPLALTALGFRPRRAAIQPKGDVGLAVVSSYANLYSTGTAGSEEVTFDGELASVVLAARYGLGRKVDVELELPFSYATGGFLDEVIEGFHEMFSLPNAGRELSPTDVFDMSISAGGQVVYQLEEESLELGDVPILVTIGAGPEGLAPERRWRSALRLGVELPTGSESKGFGNGGVDLGAGLVFERSFGRWTQFVGASFVSVEEPDAFAASQLSLEDSFEVWSALEMRADDHSSWAFQLSFRSPMVADLGIETLDDPILDLGVAYLRDVGPRSRVFASFHEDLISHSGPDVTLQAGWSWGR